MRGRGLIFTLVGVLAIAAIAVGCGSDSDDSSQASATSEIDKTTFLAKADAICTRNYENVKAGYEDFTKENGGTEKAFADEERRAEYVDAVIVPEKKETVEELEELGAPKGDEQKVEELLDAYEEGIEVAEEDPERAMATGGVFAYASSVASKYGLENCRY